MGYWTASLDVAVHPSVPAVKNPGKHTLSDTNDQTPSKPSAAAANVPSEGARPDGTYPVIARHSGVHPLANVVENYLLSLRNIAQTVQIVMPHLSKWQQDEIKKYRKKLSHFIPEDAPDGESHQIAFESARDFAELTSTLRTLEELHTNKALPVLARSLFMQMFCEFDAFMGALLKVIYLKNQDLLKGISREIAVRDLFEYESIDAIKRAMLEKEIETIRRDSYVEQFAGLEKKFQITLRKFDEWGEFVELSQRRNIFTHNDGMVSDQYLSVCEREGWKFGPRPAVGSTLHVSLDYFGRALRIMSKVGFMLAHTLWSKVFPSELTEMHDSMNDRIYQCLEHKRWKVAAEIGAFALSDPMRKGVSEINLRIRTVNVAIALKFAGREDESKRLLNSLDWSASYRDFKLAIFVLQDNFDEAVKLMRSIGKSGEILEQSAYYSWPLFHKFRERPEFYSTYQEIYGEPYQTQVPTDGKSTSVAVSEEASAKNSEAKTTERDTRPEQPRTRKRPSKLQTSTRATGKRKTSLSSGS
jgi:hypothetical protein